MVFSQVPQQLASSITMSSERSTPTQRIHKLSILIPVYNEIRTLKTLLNAVLAAPLPCDRELIIVDDCSHDGSREFLQEFAKKHNHVQLIMHKKNGGKGEAIRTAIPHMTGDWALIQDADLEYDPNEYEILLAPVLDGVADAVFGSRFLVGRYSRALFFWHMMGNKLLTLMCNVLANLNLTDIETGFKLIRADILKSLNLRSKGFDLEPELTIKLSRWGARIYQVAISYRGRTYAEGKKIGARDGFQAMVAMLKYRFFDQEYCSHKGFLILQGLRKAKRFNRWLFSHFEQWLGDHVLEAGCGIGNLTELVLTKKRLICIDNDPLYVDRLRHMYGHLENVTFHHTDLMEAESLKAAVADRPLDSVFCVNVLEHIEDDIMVLRGFYDILGPGGRAVILVPHNPRLYSEVDRTLGHYRRYTREQLRQKMEQAGFHVLECKGFNRVGGLGWRISGKILRKKTLSVGQMRLFELGMPLIRMLEKVPFHTHNSLICVAEKIA